MTKLALTLLQLVLAIGVPALIALFAPRRWRLRAIGLWVLAPLLILLAIAASEIVSGKASPADLDKLIFGVLLIGSVLLVPWLLACGVGFALGALLRGRARPQAVAAGLTPEEPPAEVAEPIVEAPAGPPPIAYAPPRDPGEPTLSPPGGWQAVHVGFDHDDVMLDGLPVWSLTWRQETDARASGPSRRAAWVHCLQRRRRRPRDPLRGGRAVQQRLGLLSLGRPR